MDRDLIARAMQNVINMSKVQMFEHFKGDQLDKALQKEMYEVADSTDNPEKCKKDIDALLAKNKKIITAIEKDQVTLPMYNTLMEDLRTWRRTYVMKQEK